MNKKLLATFAIVLSLLCVKNVFASTYYGKVTGDEVRLRKSPSASSSIIIKSINANASYTLSDITKYKDESTGSNNCSDGWYKMTINGNEGYVCSSFMVVKEIKDDDTPAPTCEASLKAKRFPDSYISGLCKLQEKHPSWNFIPYFTGLDWTETITKESRCGKAYVYATNPNGSDSIYIDSSCTNAPKGMYAASKYSLAYFMDPKNFFSDAKMFQFQVLNFDSNFDYRNGVNSIISNTEFYKYHYNNNKIDLTSRLIDSNINNNVNPIFLATRIKQELGSGTQLYGLYSGINNMYNFYNIGVFDSCEDKIQCGIDWAKAKGWTTVDAGLKGGTTLLKSYIDRGQNTLYYQKYDVITNKFIQYMTFVGAAQSESKIMYKTLYGLNMLDEPYTFNIPVYNNMDETVPNTPSGPVDDNKTTPQEPTVIPISTLVVSSGYKYSNGIIYGIGAGTDSSTVAGAISSVGGNVTITDEDNNPKSGRLGTGDKIIVKNSTSSETLSVEIPGDTSGDGVINALDLLQIQKNILGTYNLSGVHADAGDTSGDGKVNALDLLQVQKSILGTYTIG